jgi:hypothetical protein
MFNKSNKIQKQETIEITAHDKKLAFSVFHNTIVALEEYVEKIGHPGFKKQVFDKSINSPDRSPEDLAEDFLIQLYCLKAMVNKKPSFLRDEIKEKFYKWIDATGINASNCSDKLKNYLFEINEILEGGGERFVKQTENKLDNSKSTPKDALNVFSAFQNPINKNREQREVLKGKTHKDVKIENKFDDADGEKGKNTLGQILQEVAPKQDGFNFYSQSTSSSGGISPSLSDDSDEVVKKVKKSPQNWRLDEISTNLGDYYGRGKLEEWVLIDNRFARLDANAYDEYGKLDFNNNPLYRWEIFNAHQRFEIKKSLNISGDYSTGDEIKWVVKEVKDNPSIWKIKTIQEQTYLVHASAQENDSEVGTLIHNKQLFSEAEWTEITLRVVNFDTANRIKQGGFTLWKINFGRDNPDYWEHWYIDNSIDPRNGVRFDSRTMYKVKDLNEAEQKEIGYKSEERLQMATVFASENQRDNNFGTGGILVIVGVIGMLAFAGVLLVRKKLNSRSKVNKSL